uniref:sensor histidine kinase n=1 Tax=Stappia sp. TaxID=1870903 RepID=UPI003BA8A120
MAAALVPLAALAFLLSYSDHLRRADENQARFSEYARLIAQSSAKVMARAEGYASALSSNTPARFSDCLATFEGMRLDLREAVGFVARSNGDLLCAAALVDGRPQIINPQSRPDADEVLPVTRSDEETGVEVEIGLRPQTFLLAPIEATGAKSDTGFALVDGAGRVISAHLTNTEAIEDFRKLLAELAASPTSAPPTEEVGGWYVATAPLPGTDYEVVTAAPAMSSLLEPWLSITRALALPLLLLAIVFLVLRYGIQRYLLRYLRHIYSTFRRYGSGDTSARVGLMAAAPPEINVLGITFDMMADQIDGRTSDLEASLAEQTRLTRELHHRIKNTLQMITSLIAMQRREAGLPEERAVLRIALERVLAISSAYRVSYASSEGTDVPIEALVREVVETLREPAMISHGRVHITADKLAHATIDLDRAIPLAFILAELLPPRFDALAPGEAVTIAVRGGERIELAISGGGGNSDTLDEFAEETPLRSRLIRAYLHQLQATYETGETGSCLTLPGGHLP